MHSNSPTTAQTVDNAVPTGAARAFAVVRIILGWVFLWAFADKTFGLGFATPTDQGWIDGASPTAGYLASRDGTLAGLFRELAGHAWAEWLFMGGLAGLGVALTLGIGLRLAAIGGSVLMAAMWMSMLPLHDNPVVDLHVVYAVAFVALALAGAGDTWGLGRRWKNLTPVQRFPILR